MSNLRLVIQRLASQGLLKASPSDQNSPDPSFFAPFLPPLLDHLHPSPASPLKPYPTTFLPSLILPLSSSTIATFVSGLLQHLVYRLPQAEPAGPLLPDKPDQRIICAVIVLEAIIGPAIVGDEAWDAVVNSVNNGRMDGEVRGERSHAMVRVVTGWISRRGEKGKRRSVENDVFRTDYRCHVAIKAFIDIIMETWTDPKHIKYSFYAKQFCKAQISLKRAEANETQI